MIIWLASYPRSGNTFLRIILNRLYNIPSSEVYKPYQDNLRQMTGYYAFSSLEVLANAKETYFIKTHDLPQEDFPAMYIVRDGRDAIVSHAHYVLNFDHQIPVEKQSEYFPGALHGLITMNSPTMGNWSHNVDDWEARKTKTAIIRFEQLIRDPVNVVRHATEELGITLPETNIQPPTFEELQRENPQFFQRGQEGRWIAEMPKTHLKLFWRYHGNTMLRMGYAPKSPDEIRWSKQSTSSAENFMTTSYRRLRRRVSLARR